MVQLDVSAQQLAEVFSGHKFAYGQSDYRGGAFKNDKITPACATIKKPPTIHHYIAHIKGAMGLGIIPITQDDKATFGAIDFDFYDSDTIKNIVKVVENFKLPLVPCYSKSKGLHLFLLLDKPTTAINMRKYLKSFADALTLNSILKRNGKSTEVEIFPKQDTLQGGHGNWINLPYFGGDVGPAKVLYNGKQLNMDEGIQILLSKKVSEDYVRLFIKEECLEDAPPCLKQIYFNKDMDKGAPRNNTLFSFAVYYKKRFGASWQQQLKKLNSSLSDPLSGEEIANTVLKSVENKEYFYRCSEPALSNYCDKAACSTCKFGVASDLPGPAFDRLTFGVLEQFGGADPYYTLEIHDNNSNQKAQIIFNNVDELLNQNTLRRFCAINFRIVLKPLKPELWRKFVEGLLQKAKEEEVPLYEDNSEDMGYIHLLRRFIDTATRALSKLDIAKGSVYYNKHNQVYFVKRCFVDYIKEQDKNKYAYLRLKRLYTAMEVVHKVVEEKGKRLNCFSIDLENFDKYELFSTDTQEQDEE